MGRIIGILVLLIAIVIGGALWYVYSNVDELVKRAIETAGSDAAGVAVTVEDVEVVLEEGRATVRGLRLANPPGFSEDAPIFELGEISVGIDLASLQEMAPLVIDEVTVRSPHVRYEVDARGKSNIDALEAGMGGGEDDGGEGASDGGEPLKMRVREFLFEKGEITADLTAIGEKERTLELPAIRLTDLGGRNGGTGDEISQQAIDALTDRVTRRVARLGVEAVIDKALGGTSSEAKSAVKGLLDQLGR